MIFDLEVISDKNYLYQFMFESYFNLCKSVKRVLAFKHKMTATGTAFELWERSQLIINIQWIHIFCKILNV